MIYLLECRSHFARNILHGTMPPRDFFLSFYPSHSTGSSELCAPRRSPFLGKISNGITNEYSKFRFQDFFITKVGEQTRLLIKSYHH